MNRSTLIHMNKNEKYSCNQAVKAVILKLTKDKNKVTCCNCLRKINPLDFPKKKRNMGPTCHNIITEEEKDMVRRVINNDY